ncbi:Mbov_0401 family ICE element transposase-like protein [Candidatus Mycoplasma pogonae]
MNKKHDDLGGRHLPSCLKCQNEIILERYKEQVEVLEWQFRDSFERKNMGWKIQFYRTKKVKTPYGIAEFSLIHYRNKDNKIVQFNNPFLNQIEAAVGQSRFDVNLKNKIKHLIQNGYTYQNVIKEFGNIFSIATVSRIANEKEVDNKLNDYFLESKNKEYLYIETDDAFQNLRFNGRKSIKILSRLFVMHLGKNANNKIVGANALIENELVNSNKRATIKQLANMLLMIRKYYYSDHLKIVLYGDGARHMKQLAKLLNAKYILDPYHLNSKLLKVIGYKNYKTINKQLFAELADVNLGSIYQQIRYLLWHVDWKKAVEKLWEVVDFLRQKMAHEVISKSLGNSKINEIFAYIKYLKLNKMGLNQYQEKYHIGSNTETFVSHIIKRKTVNRYTAIGYKLFKNIIIRNINDMQHGIYFFSNDLNFIDQKNPIQMVSSGMFDYYFEKRHV